jgi:hypothetical protein
MVPPDRTSNKGNANGHERSADTEAAAFLGARRLLDIDIRLGLFDGLCFAENFPKRLNGGHKQ